MGGSHQKREIEVPAYITGIARVQVYCSWAEVLLGEAGFAAPVRRQRVRFLPWGHGHSVPSFSARE